MSDPVTDVLIQRLHGGDATARDELLTRHRDRLRQMVAVRMDRRLMSRIDPSDVVQEALAEACLKLPRYLEDRPIPFYPWLRQIAWERLVKLHRRHLWNDKRSVAREEDLHLPDESALQLADRLIGKESSPSARAVREELKARIHAGLAALPVRDREVLAMRHLEHMTMAEIAAVLGISENAVKVRHLRALQRFHQFLGGAGAPDAP
ncbi:MAG TPA: sigma-70 family RNA polymerase sigma factor [Gemmataceae bacterium]|nr:sigma-70 family RNA polymerase sigma factor [Gemmataceae bacterium]